MIKLKKIIKIIFIIVCLLWFWYFTKSYYWLYVDNSLYPLTSTRYYNLINGFFYTISNWTFFWYDNTSIQSSRFLGHLLLCLPMFCLFFLFFTVNFISSFLLLKQFFSKKSSIFWALIYSFNPVSLLFLNLTWFIFAYTSLTIILLSVYYIINSKRYIFIIILLLWLIFLTSYTRLLWIYFVFLVLIWLFYYKEIFKFLQGNKWFSLFVIISTILLLSPFVFANIYPYIVDWEREYFSWVGNYASTWLSWWEGMYNSILYQPFYEKIILSELTSNFAKSFQKNIFFILISIIFIFGTFIYSFFIKKHKYNTFHKYLSVIFIFIIFIVVWPHFLSKDIFIDIAYKYFPFIANNTNWLYVVIIPIVSFVFAYAIDGSKNIVVKNLLYILGSLYLFVSVFPFLNFSNNEKLTIMRLKDFPNNYVATFHVKQKEIKAALFLPDSNLYFQWSPYHLSLTNNNYYQSIFSSNSRLVNTKQANLYSTLQAVKSSDLLINTALFNLKNIFVFKDVKNAKEWQFDFFPIRDYEAEAKEYYEKLSSNESLYIKQDNENFAQFGLKDDDKYEYFLYSPGKIEKYTMEEFFSTGNTIDIYQKPVNIDPDSFNKSAEIDAFQIPEENKNIKITYKKSNFQPTKIYLKIRQVDVNKNFLVQLNQTFGMSWKLKWITKEEFEEKQCIDEYREYDITQNKYCNYKAQILDTPDTKYLHREQVPNSQHFEWNFVGNTWLIKPENIPEDMKSQDELYAVIIYEKQIWYNYTLIVSGITLIILLFLTLFQETQKFFSKKKKLFFLSLKNK